MFAVPTESCLVTAGGDNTFVGLAAGTKREARTLSFFSVTGQFTACCCISTTVLRGVFIKRNRYGRAAILSQSEIQLLFSDGLQTVRDRALFAVMLFTACRVREACTLLRGDVFDKAGRVFPVITFRKSNTKGKLATRTIPVNEELRQILLHYYSEAGTVYLFPGRFDYLKPDSVDDILRKACYQVGLEGVSTHSFRRTALSLLSANREPLRVVQEISGHRDLGQLQKYLEVAPEQVRVAVAGLSILSPVRAHAPEPSLFQEDSEKYH